MTGRGVAYSSNVDYCLHELAFEISKKGRKLLNLEPGLALFTEYPDKNTIRVYVTEYGRESKFRDERTTKWDYSFDDISHEQAIALDTFKFYIKEAKTKGISLDELYDYIISRTFENQRSQYYNNSGINNYYHLDELQSMINNVSDINELIRLSNKANKVVRERGAKNLSSMMKAYEVPYDDRTEFDQIFDISDYVETWSKDDENNWPLIRELSDSIIEDVRLALK